MFNKKAQGTIEYLVIIAIVVVIALVVVGILIQLLGQGAGINETNSKIAWQSAEPWAITDWDHNGTQLTIVLQNNTAKTMDFVSITVNGDANNDSGQTGVSPNTKITRTIQKACTSGTKYSYSTVTIDYNSEDISGKQQTGIADIIGTC